MTDITEVLELQLLTKLRCSYCNGYLSVPPIWMQMNDETSICGRCKSNIGDDGTFMHNTELEILARQFSFPCTFSNNGCLIKKQFNQMKVHEEECLYRPIECKHAACNNWSGTASEFIIHFKNCHGTQVVKNYYCVELFNNSDRYFVVSDKHFSFLVEYNFSLPKFTIRISSLDLLPSIFDGIGFELTMTTKCTETVSTITDFVNINLTKQLTLPPATVLLMELKLQNAIMNKEIAKSLVCGNCSRHMPPPILRCSAGCVICLDCTGLDHDYCTICEHKSSFKRDYWLDLLTSSMIYKCQWKNCNSYFNVLEIQTHEQSCCKRKYVCCHCNKWEGLLCELVQHNKLCTSNPLLLFTSEITVRGNEVDSENEDKLLRYTIVAHNELFNVVFSKCDSDMITILLIHAPSSYFGWFDYKILLQHVEDVHFPGNKAYNFDSNYQNIYSLKIPNDIIHEFGSSEVFKITVKIRLLTGGEKKKSVEEYLNIFKD